MPTKTNTTQEGLQAITPYLAIKNAASAIDFYKKAFGAVETMRLMQPDGRVGHAELKIGEGSIMLADEFPEMNCLGPQSRNGTTVTLHLVIDNVDTIVNQAVAAGATLERPPKDEFYGMRAGTIMDPFGHRWMISTYIEHVSPEEMQKRLDELYGAKK